MTRKGGSLAFPSELGMTMPECEEFLLKVKEEALYESSLSAAEERYKNAWYVIGYREGLENQRQRHLARNYVNYIEIYEMGFQDAQGDWQYPIPEWKTICDESD